MLFMSKVTASVPRSEKRKTGTLVLINKQGQKSVIIPDIKKYETTQPKSAWELWGMQIFWKECEVFGLIARFRLVTK